MRSGYIKMHLTIKSILSKTTPVLANQTPLSAICGESVKCIARQLASTKYVLQKTALPGSMSLLAF
jgi:hypothetical protein